MRNYSLTRSNCFDTFFFDVLFDLDHKMTLFAGITSESQSHAVSSLSVPALFSSQITMFSYYLLKKTI